ncbi:MAG: hypothetical protein ACE5DM_05640, partial [Candidatus Nanoarchaeia archaeon]
QGQGTDIATMGGGGGMGDLMENVRIDFSSLLAFFSSLGAWMISIKGVFLMLAGIQGLFAGLVLGQLAEGNIRAGFKHSLILITLAFLVITLAQGALNQQLVKVAASTAVGTVA